MKLPKHLKDFFKSTGAKGGASKSEAKTEAARANGKRGGRPKSTKRKPRGHKGAQLGAQQ